MAKGKGNSTKNKQNKKDETVVAPEVVKDTKASNKKDKEKKTTTAAEAIVKDIKIKKKQKNSKAMSLDELVSMDDKQDQKDFKQLIDTMVESNEDFVLKTELENLAENLFDETDASDEEPLILSAGKPSIDSKEIINAIDNCEVNDNIIEIVQEIMNREIKSGNFTCNADFLKKVVDETLQTLIERDEIGELSELEKEEIIRVLHEVMESDVVDVKLKAKMDEIQSDLVDEDSYKLTFNDKEDPLFFVSNLNKLMTKNKPEEIHDEDTIVIDGVTLSDSGHFSRYQAMKEACVWVC